MTEQTKGPDFYRERAALMRQHAHYTRTEKTRFVYLELAAYWDQLADMIEKNAVRSGTAGHTASSPDLREQDAPFDAMPENPLPYGPLAPRR